MKKRVLTLFVVVMILSLAVCCIANAQEAEKKVIKVASNVTLPFEIFWDGDEIHGYEADVYHEVLRRAGYEVEVVDLAFSGILPGLLAEKWDLACSEIFITAERMEEMDFCDPFNESFEKMIVPNDSPIQTWEDLKGKVVGAETGTSQAMWAASLQEKYGPFEIKTYDDRATQYLDLDTGRIDALAGGNSGGMTGDEPGTYRLLGYSEENSMISCAVRKGDPLKDIFNKYLNELKEEGVTAELYEKYYGDTPPEHSAITDVFTEPYVPEKH